MLETGNDKLLTLVSDCLNLGVSIVDYVVSEEVWPNCKGTTTVVEVYPPDWRGESLVITIETNGSYSIEIAEKLFYIEEDGVSDIAHKNMRTILSSLYEYGVKLSVWVSKDGEWVSASGRLALNAPIADSTELAFSSRGGKSLVSNIENFLKKTKVEEIYLPGINKNETKG